MAFSACSQKKAEQESNAMQGARPLPSWLMVDPPVDGKQYKGKANFAETQDFEVSFILSEDKKEIQNLSISITDLNVSATYENMRIEQKGGKVTTKYTLSFPVQDNKAEIDLGKNGNMSIKFDETGASGTINYTYIISASSEGQSSHPELPVYFGERAMRFQPQ